ncbi:hypothetical protein QOT19_23475 [Serratia marcescens]|uniref:hypothetical protein n=1 Tax=Serratia marcescens TaxID=615 RepID=UPI00273152E2|nr:hypothetical protein [Serratia marcescens]MDP0522287.1 hypothetical protein [Serratia marcescens]
MTKINIYNQEVDEAIYGYVINDNIFFDIKRGCLWNIDVKNHGSKSISRVVLRKTTNRLLTFMLHSYTSCGSADAEIDVENLMFNVWDKYNLQSSNQRLWQSIKFLNFKLIKLGEPEDMFFRSGGTLFVRSYVRIKPLHIV